MKKKDFIVEHLEFGCRTGAFHNDEERQLAGSLSGHCIGHNKCTNWGIDYEFSRFVGSDGIKPLQRRV